MIDKEFDAVIKHWADIDDKKNKTLLCYWYGEPLYEEDVPRKKLLEIVKHQAKDLEHTREQHLQDVNFLSSL